jgi:hypothetical protein
MLEHKVGPIALEHSGETTDDDRMREPFKEPSLAGKGTQSVLVVDEVRSHELHDDERVEVLIPRKEHLVAPTTPDLAQRESTGDDGITLGEAPPLARCGPRLPALF